MLSEKEINMTFKITEIEKIYPDWYDPNHALSREDQQFIWENAPLSKEDEQRLRKQQTPSANVNVYENVNGGYKQIINQRLIWNKPKVILQLKQCSVETPPNQIALLLEELFSPWPSEDGHWLWIAQRYTPRTINWQISSTIKAYLRGVIRKTPPVYFTYELKFRKRRKLLHQKELGNKQ